MKITRAHNQASQRTSVPAFEFCAFRYAGTKSNAYTAAPAARRYAEKKGKVMKHFNMLVFPSILFALLIGCSNKEITETEVYLLLDTLEAASKAHDANGIASVFTKNARIIIDAPDEMEGKKDISVKQYIMILNGFWKVPLEHDYKVESREVYLNTNTANVKGTSRETVKHKGKILSSTKTEEEIDIVYVNDALLIEKMYGKVSN